jgi:hypothetical protein
MAPSKAEAAHTNQDAQLNMIQIASALGRLLHSPWLPLNLYQADREMHATLAAVVTCCLNLSKLIARAVWRCNGVELWWPRRTWRRLPGPAGASDPFRAKLAHHICKFWTVAVASSRRTFALCAALPEVDYCSACTELPLAVTEKACMDVFVIAQLLELSPIVPLYGKDG